jgi:4-hydroxybenzoate polyprenyltransferase
MASEGICILPGGFLRKIKEYGTLVMFPHTVFSLSFAVVAMLLAAGGLPQPRKLIFTVIAFLGARTGANALNRAIDADIDALNPRTAARQIPQKLIDKPEVVAFSCACFAVMMAAALMLNPLCLLLSPAALVFMVFYSYTKRFTWLCHLILGVTTACAPVGAWIAVTGRLAWTPLVMGAANTLWVAGFDIVYGAQDYAFDRANGLHSMPVRFGVGNSLAIATAFHGASALLLAAVGFLSPRLGVLYEAGVFVIAALLVVEHRLISTENLKNVKIASYGINQLVSVVYMIAGILDALN